MKIVLLHVNLQVFLNFWGKRKGNYELQILSPCRIHIYNMNNLM